MTNTNWVNVEAARTRLEEIEAIVAKLTGERDLIRSVLSPGAAEPVAEKATEKPVSPVSAPRPVTRRRLAGERPTMGSMLADVMARGPRGKGWSVGELIAKLPAVHPEWTAPHNASALVSAALAQAVRSRNSLFTSRKIAGRRGNVYRLA